MSSSQDNPGPQAELGPHAGIDALNVAMFKLDIPVASGDDDARVWFREGAGIGVLHAALEDRIRNYALAARREKDWTWGRIANATGLSVSRLLRIAQVPPPSAQG